jgi:hypothetical protein
MVLPKPAAPCLGVHRLTKSHPSGPLLAGPDHTCSRENSREGEPSVLPSAVLESPDPTRPCQNAPIPATPRRVPACHIYSPKRAAEGAEAPSAAVCSGCRSAPKLASPYHITPRRANPNHATSGFQRTQQRGPKPSVLRSSAVTSPVRVRPCHNV